VRSFPCRLVESEVNSGAGAARNLGVAHASAPLIYFLDADILIGPQTLARMIEAFKSRPDVCAIFGSFAPTTIPQNFVSAYKNLLHHYTHQTAREDANTFCGGFSSIRREVFLAAGGFDPAYRYMEDVELGYRLHRAGYRIWLRKDLQVTHAKRLTLAELIRSDLFGRAIPWTRIMLEKQIFSNDLNTQVHHVLSVPLSFLILGSLAAAPRWLWLTALLGILFVLLNRGFLSFVQKQRGWWFAFRAAMLCWFGYLYSAAGAALGIMGYAQDRLLGRGRAAAMKSDPASLTAAIGRRD
jgi:GT2 family glycosyltransferase